LRKIVTLLAEAFIIQQQTTARTPIVTDEDLKAWHEAIQSPATRELARKLSDIADDLEVLTESFYFLAHRACKAAQALPGLESFESVGIRNVRNQLIEHPEGKSSGVLMMSFGFGGDCGPVIKALRLQQQVDIWPDRGLFANADEFADNLIVSIKTALSSNR
jgi:hypothetical protein